MIALALAVAGHALAGQAVPAAAVIDPFDGIPNVTISSYAVHGRDLDAIRASLKAVEPRDRNDGERVEAVTHWRFTWQWPSTPGGGCRLDRATVRFAATVTLPRLVGLATLPPELGAHWRLYLAQLEAHEAMHVRYAYDHRGEVLAAIQGATCDTAEAAGQAVLRRLVDHDIAFDRDTHHGRTVEPGLE